MAHRIDSDHFDAAESVFFKRELEDIDKRVYEKRYPALMATKLIPMITGVAPETRVYTWREFDKKGAAKIIGDYADDLPRIDVDGAEYSQVIKDVGDSYQYSIMEVKAAAKGMANLDELRASAARYFVEEKIDSILSLGDAASGLKGILNLANTTAFTPGTKTAGGLTWGTVAAPNATGEEVAADLIGIVSKLHETTKGLWSSFKIVLPLAQYNYAAFKRLGTNNDTTALAFAKSVCPFISDVVPWTKCTTAGAGQTARMAAFPDDNMVLGALLPRQYEILPAQERNLAFVINGTASIGGVICRYPVAVSYGDGI